MKTIQVVLLLFLALIFSQKSYGQNYHVILDKNVSSISSAESLTSLHHSIYTFEEKIFPKRIGQKIESKFLRKNVNRFFRLSKGFFWDLPIASLFSISQHEIFGHGYQYRNFNYIKNSYNINMPWPYGKGGGFARRGTLESPRIRSKHEDISIYYGGAEATRLFSNTITKKWILSDSIHYKEAFLGLRTFNSPHLAMLFMKEITPESFDDFSRYLVGVNNYYGYSGLDNHKLTRNHIRKKALINFLNPFIGMSFYSVIVNYSFKGETNGKLNWIKMGRIKYLPSFRIGLTPFGDETFFESFLKKENKAARVYYRHGNPVFEKFNGFGIETIHLFNFSKKIILDFNLDGWKQPELELGGEEIRLSKKGFGGLVKINFQIRMWESPQPVYLSGQIGYKTDGYIEGEPLSKGLILRYGIAYDFREK